MAIPIHAISGQLQGIHTIIDFRDNGYKTDFYHFDVHFAVDLDMKGVQHARVARRLHAPRCGQNRLGKSSEGMSYLACYRVPGSCEV